MSSDRGLDEARIGRERDLRKLEVNREKEVETALMEKAITLYQKSLEQSAAQAEAENAKARATEAAERVITVRDSEIAKRRKTIEVLIAEKEAEEKRSGAAAARRSNPRHKNVSTRPRTCSPTRRATRCSAASCSTASRASCARASGRWRRSRAFAFCTSTVWPAATGARADAAQPTK